MSIKRQVVIEVDDNGAIKSINDLSKSLDNNTSEINKNTEAQKQLGKESGSATELIKKQDRDIKVLDSSIKLLGGALETTIGSMAVFGISSDNIESIERATIGSIALADGAKRTFDGIKGLNVAFKEVGGLAGFVSKNFNAAAIATRAQSAATRVATVVQSGFNAVLALNPAAIVVASIAGLVTLIVTLKDKVEIFNKIATGFNTIMTKIGQSLGLAATEAEKLRKAQEELTSQLEFDLKLAKAREASIEEQIKLERQILQLRVQTAKNDEERKKALEALVEFNVKNLRRQFNETKTAIEGEEKLKQETRDKEIQDAQDRANKLREIAQQLSLDVELIGLSDADKARLLAKRQFEERIQGFQEGSQAFLDAQALFRDEEEKIRIQETAKEEADEETRLQRIEDIQKQYIQRLEDLRATNEEQKVLLEKQRALDELEELKATEEQKLELVKFYDNLIQEARKQDRETTLENERAFKDARLALEFELVGGIANAFNAISSLAGQNTDAGKVAAIADIALRTGVGFVNGLQIAQQAAIATGPAAAFAFPAFYATQIGAVLQAASQANKILNTVPGGGSFSLPSTPDIPSVGTTTATQSRPNRVPPTVTPQEPVRAYVLTGDVTTGIDAEKRINNRRTL